MPRSLRVQQNCIHKVKLALGRNGFPSQRSLAEDVGFSLATVSNFLTGKPVDYTTFEELCRKLGLNWREISTLELEFVTQNIGRSPEHGPPNRTVRGSSIDSDSDMSPQYPNGAVPIGSPYYLERAAVTAQIDRELRKPGALVRIKAPQEMGKTSLLMRVLDTAKSLGYQTVSLNFTQVDEPTLGDLDRFLRWLCANVARQLQLKPMLAEYWDEDIGSKISCSAYFQDYLLAQIATPLVLALDEANRIFEHPQIAKDFFPLLRFWYGEAKTLPIWQKLRLVVVHSTEIYIPLQIDQSPFNVGLPIQLHNFSQPEVQQLARSYGVDWDDGVAVGQLMELVGGHPSLVNLALYHLSREDLTLAQLLQTAPTASGIYHHHLQRHWVSLEAQPELLLVLNAVMNAIEPVAVEPTVAHKLISMGLVRLLDDKAISACELYRLFFLKNNSVANHVEIQT